MPESNYSLRVNGETRRIRTENTMPLLWALRDVVGLTGTKYGCGIIQCGACHVMLNGTVTKSCNVTVGAAARKTITTIEGLDTPIARAVKDAWIAEQVPRRRTTTSSCSDPTAERSVAEPRRRRVCR